MIVRFTRVLMKILLKNIADTMSDEVTTLTTMKVNAIITSSIRMTIEVLLGISRLEVRADENSIPEITLFKFRSENIISIC